jgi:hypothetical protein
VRNISNVGVSVYKVNGDVTFSGNAVKSVQITNEINVSADTLPKGVCDIYLNSADKDKLNKIQFAKGEELEVYYNGELHAVYYVNEAKRISKYGWHIDTHNVLGELEDKEFFGGSFPDEYTDYDTAGEVLQYIAESSEIDFDIEDSLYDFKVNGYILYTNCLSALQQVCFITQAVAVADGRKVKVYIPSREISQTVDRRRVKQGVKTNTKKELLDGVSRTYEDKLLGPSTENEAVAIIKDGSVGDLRFIDFGEPRQYFTLLGVKPIRMTSVAALVELIDYDSTGGSTRGILARKIVLRETVTRKYIFGEGRYGEFKLAQITGLTLTPSVENIDKTMELWYNSYINKNSMTAKIVNGKYTNKKRSTYGQYLYGESVYGYIDISDTTVHKAVNIGDTISVPTEYGENFVGIVTREKYNLSSSMLVKDIELKEVIDNGIEE